MENKKLFIWELRHYCRAKFNPFRFNLLVILLSFSNTYSRNCSGC